MSSANASPFPRERKLILALLLILAAASWALLIWQSAAMNSQAMGMGLTMGMSAVFFIAIWVVMMIAMMFPTAAPMILMFTTVYAGKKQRSQAFVPTWVFVSAYLLIWTLFGLVAYPLALFAESLAGQSMWLMTNAPRIGGPCWWWLASINSRRSSTFAWRNAGRLCNSSSVPGVMDMAVPSGWGSFTGPTVSDAAGSCLYFSFHLAS